MSFDLFTLAFYALAALTVGSGAFVAFSRNIIHSTIALLGCFLGMAGLYVQLSADFLAAVQVLVYVGGTLTLILFAVMLTSRIADVRSSNTSVGLLAGLLTVGVVLVLLGRVLVDTAWPVQGRPPMPSSAKLGHAFLADYLLPFELGSVVLLTAMIGAVVIARRAVKREGDKP